MVPFTHYGPDAGVAPAVDAAVAALRDADATFADIEAFYGGAAHPLSPRAPQIAQQLGLTGAAVQHITNASATGLAAVHEAAHAIEAGAADVVLVVGYDIPQHHLATEQLIVAENGVAPVVSFALVTQLRMAASGTSNWHLAAVAAKNWNYARSNPFAARRASAQVTPERVLASKVVAEPLTTMMCTSWTEGAAAVVLCSKRALSRFTRHRPVRLAGSVLRSAAAGIEGSMLGTAELTRATARSAYELSGIEPRDVDIVQVHDAFSIEEIQNYELLGFSEPGETEKLIEAGAFGPGSRHLHGKPEFSTDGGLIARGHPGGPTGVAQIWETVRQLREPDGARIGLCHLIGTGAVSVAQLYERAG
ncbi:thiolase family protein [Streptomyces griseorubiginosus]|uniref:thiolase family protein n=1 Tax=Streptomyces griseorubiginosus TaxID=67304 RepID=UPI001AD65D64|nr:thiolase family protein [Streptomyces griseorubiginosus]MBO4256223.1 thiolase family protein [Streptomyces griseorubiginosus]